MADATPITVGEFLAKLSEFYPYGDEPPRLCAALNDARTDAPDGTVFDETTGAALEHHALPPYTAATITDILSWVSKRLDTTLTAAWMSQLGCMAQWLAPDPAAAEDEIWAQVVAEYFLGTTYSGPTQLYNMGAPFIERNGAGKRPPIAAGESWEQFHFRRVERRYPRQLYRVEGDKARGAFDLQRWDRLEPESAGLYEEPWLMHENKDPATPIGIACQHMTTYGALLRGIPLDWLGNATTPRAGFMASDASAGLPVFGAPVSVGTSPYGGADKLVTPPAPAGKWVAPTPTLVEMDTLRAAGVAPGTIVVFDPDSGAKKDAVTLYLSKYEQQDEVHREVLKDYFYTRKTVGSADFAAAWETPARQAPAATYVAKIDAQIERNEKRIVDLQAKVTQKSAELAKKTKPDDIAKSKADLEQKQLLLDEAIRNRPTLQAQRTLAGDASTSAFTYSFNEQLPGSHIYFILRVHKDGKSMQAFDVSSGGALAHLMKPSGASLPTGKDSAGSEAILARSGEDAHLDGYKLTGISSGDGKQLAGIGVLPKVTGVGEHASFVRTARPIGLVRLVISERTRTVGKKVHPGLADKNQILYVSPLVPMYGPSPEQNYPISKLLWALRNTPGFSDLQVWWCVSAPQGLLAKAMWAEGAREMTLRKFIDTFTTSEDWSYWSFFLPSYFPGLDPAPPQSGLIPAKRKKIRKDLVWELHHRLHVVLTNEGDKAMAGKVSNVCRYKNGEGNGNRKASPMDPPEPLMSVLKGLAWDKTHLRADLEKHRADIESATPAFFQANPPSPAADAPAPESKPPPSAPKSQPAS